MKQAGSNDGQVRQAPIAIVGMAGLFPRAQGLKPYWRLIRGSADAVTDVPASHWRPDDYFDADPKSPDMTYCRRGAFLSALDFDPTEFGIPPAALEATDTAQLLGLVAAKCALEDAGLAVDAEFDHSKTSVILGVTGTLELVIPLGARLGHPYWRRALHDAGIPDEKADEIVRRISEAYVPWQENSFPGLLGNVVAGRIANRLNLKGTNCVVDAACASSLAAVHLASMELAAGRSDVVVTGGVDTLNDIFMFMCFSKTQALSSSGDARPFSRDADGTVIGEGVGILVLKRLEDAQRDGDRIYAVLRGVGSSSDGRSQSIYAPRAEGQAEALRNAYRLAGIEPNTVELVEAHGTGTKVGDVVEFEALQRVYRESRAEGAWCGIGSVKSQIGHTKAAAGAASLIKAVLALHHRTLPGTIKVSEPNPKLNIDDSPFYINTETRPWLPRLGHPRRAAVSSFGFGGSNFHAVLEEDPTANREPAWDGSVDIVALSAPDAEQLKRAVATWHAEIEGGLKGEALATRAAESRKAFNPGHAQRLTLVLAHDADPAEHFAAALAALSGSRRLEPRFAESIFLGDSADGGKLAFLFPGQASQYVNMGRDLACTFPEVLDAIAEAGDCGKADKRLGDCIYPPPTFDADRRSRQESELTDTRIAQPAIGAVSLGFLRVLERFGVQPAMTAGHSYGELVALRAAGRIDDDTLRQLSRIRGRLMSESGTESGTMAAVQADLDEIESMIHSERLDVVLANRNTPTQGILSGSRDAMERAAKACGSRGWRVTPLKVSGAFHSPLMRPAHAAYRPALDSVRFRNGRTPVLANCSAEAYPQDAAATRDLLAAQLIEPVRFVEIVERLYADGVRTFVEVGPGNVLSGMVRSILRDRAHHVVAMDASAGRKDGVADFARVLARLAAAGHSVELSRWEEAPRPRRRAKMSVPLLGTNYRSPRAEPPASATRTDVRDRNEENHRVNRDMTDQKNDSRQSESPPTQQHAPGSQHPRPTAAPAPQPVHTPGQTDQLAGVFQVVQEGLRAMQALQQQTAAAHQRFLEGQEQAHKTFQMVMESQQRLFESLGGIQPAPAQATSAPTAPTPAAPSSFPAAAPAPAPTDFATPTPAPAQPPSQPAPANPPNDVPAPVPAAASTSGRDDSADAPAATNGFEPVLLEVVSELTGYPVEMLDPNMDMEADLGIDSIKRVEILAAVQERMPNLKAVESTELGRLRTLTDIINQMGGDAAATASPAPTGLAASGEPIATPTQTAPAHSEPAAPGAFQQVLLEVVSELTGYPIEMLDPDMDMEADLGIDSIKRVEILAAVQSRMPELPTVESSDLGGLRTLTDIVRHMSAEAPSTPPAPAAAIPEPEPEQAPEVRLARHVLRAVELPPALERPLCVAPGSEVWVVNDGTRLATALAERLVAQGIAARVVGTSAPVEGEACAPVGGLIHLVPPTPPGNGILNEDTQEQLKGAFSLTRELAADIRRAAAEGGAIFATVSRMDGGFGLLGGEYDVVQGGLAGLTKTVAHEWPGTLCRALDVDPEWQDADAVAERILLELAAEGPVEVGVSRYKRRGLELASSEAMAGDLPLRQGDVVVVSGGARGVTAECAVALAEAAKPTLVLLGRSPEPKPEPEWSAGVESPAELKRAILTHVFGNRKKPSPSELEAVYRRHVANREISANIARMKAAGARVVYKSVDICKSDVVRHLFNEIRRSHGPIRGLIHGAGVIEDHLIEDKDPELFDRVFDTKVTGLDALLRGASNDDLKCLVLFSSVSARFGRQGQVDYAMANEVLNKAAHRLAAARPRCRVVSLNWGPWDGGMVNDSLKRQFAESGIDLIPLQAGAAAMIDELRASGSKDIEVMIGGGFPQVQSVSATAAPNRAGDSATVAEPAHRRTKPASASERSVSVVFERQVDVETHPFLTSHVLGGKPVLPAAMMIEWLAHGALHDNPGLLFQGLDDFRVLKGVMLEGGARDIEVTASRARRADGAFKVDLELRSRLASGETILHASATAILDGNSPAPLQPPALDGLAARPYSRDPQAIYRDVLFHGPHFRMIQSIEGLSEKGMVATLATGARAADWMVDPPRSGWIADPLAIDGALQVGILWCHETHDAVALPSAGARYRQYARSFPGGSVKCVLQVTQSGRRRLIGDVAFLDATGAVVAVMEGYQWTMDRSLAKAFGKPETPTAPRVR